MSHGLDTTLYVLKPFKLDFYRRSFFAIARMVLNPEEYASTCQSGQSNLKAQMTEWDVLHQEESKELEDAQQIVRVLFDRFHFDENDLDGEVMKGGKHWMALGDILKSQ